MSGEGGFGRQETGEAYPDGIQNHWWHRARSGVVLRLLKRSGAEGRILDIGCGRGITVAFLRSRGWDCIGCDVAGGPPILPEMAPFLRFRTPPQDLEPGMAGGIRAILLLDILEHLPDPVSFIARQAIHFPNADRLILTVPAGPELWSHFDGHFGHRRRYTREGVLRLLEHTPFAVAEAGHFFHLLYPPLRTMVALGRRREIRARPPRSRPGKAAHFLIAGWFLAETRLFPRAFRGTSLYALCRKREDRGAPGDSG